MKVSVIIIVRNEEDKIENCLEHVKWADEIVVIDTGSTDKTVELCRKYTDKIHRSDWLGFGQLKNLAISKTSNNWILNVDSDELVSKELIEEIMGLQEDNVAAYYIPFHNHFMGKRMRFGGMGNEKHIRLFNKKFANFADDVVHEAVKVNGKKQKLKGYIEHRSYKNLDVYFAKFNQYTALIAREKFKKGKRFPINAFLRIPYEFIMRYFIKLGFLDGRPGFIYASISAFYAGVKYFKLYEYQIGARK